MFLFWASMFLPSILLMTFHFLSKGDSWDDQSSSSFESGYSSYFMCRFFYSIHFFLVGLVFLFLDLELCFIMPFLLLEFSDFKIFLSIMFFVVLMLLGLLLEWGQGKIDWLL